MHPALLRYLPTLAMRSGCPAGMVSIGHYIGRVWRCYLDVRGRTFNCWPSAGWLVYPGVDGGFWRCE
jgi:hypothetical protein